jgi:hypothetical protein
MYSLKVAKTPQTWKAESNIAIVNG